MGKVNTKRLVELLLNSFCVVLAVFMTASILLDRVAGDRTSDNSVVPLKLGQPVPIEGIEWAKHRYTLLFALSVDCRFCTESSPFYQALLKARQNSGWNAIALLPQSKSIAADYLSLQGLSLKDVRQVDLQRIGVTATPTLLLVDARGNLRQMWIGRLSQPEENDVARHLEIGDWSKYAQEIKRGPAQGVRERNSPVLTQAELIAMLQNQESFNLIDVRDRSEFASSHMRGAINIPAAELAVRASHEFLLTAPTVLYCKFAAICEATGRPSLCSLAVAELRSIGIQDVRVIRDPLPLLSEGGVPVETASN